MGKMVVESILGIAALAVGWLALSVPYMRRPSTDASTRGSRGERR
jgi:hypothetical protein